MLLSIDNFKSIERVTDIDISVLTVLAGINSSGKSSLIQALLLLKQTLTSANSDMLRLDGPYVFANNLLELMHNKKVGTMKFGILLSREELLGTELFDLYGESGLSGLHLIVKFRVRSDESTVEEVSIKTLFESSTATSDSIPVELSLVKRPRKKDSYVIEYGSLNDDNMYLDEYSFANFFPVFARKGDKVYDITLSKIVRNSLSEVLRRVAYIAPLRVAPVLARTYQTDVESTHVLPDGENTRFILDKMAAEDPEGVELVKKWICSEFRLAKDLNVVKESGKRYRVVVTTNDGLKVDLLHMGFGLSQILPIIVQGCLSKPNSLLIVEDPDVHMHPSIQASMADFFIGISKHRKVNVLIETHSDHFITRLRRRVAEKEIGPKDVHLIFVENEFGASEYQTIPLSPQGRPEGSMPKGFMDSLDADYRAILIANRK